MTRLPDHATLLPIDMQRAFDSPPWPRRSNPALDDNGLALLARWRALGRPIIHVRHDSVQPGSTLAAGLPGHAFRAGFTPLDGEALVGKSVNAAFIGTDLDLRLRRLGARTIVMFGITTDQCVSTTARVGANLGYDVVVVADACAAFDLNDRQGNVISAEEVHRIHLATLAFEFGRVADTQEMLAA